MTILKQGLKKAADSVSQDEEMEDLLERSLEYMKAGYPIHFTGPSGVGKTSLAIALAKRRKKPVMLIHGNHEMGNKDLIGDFTGYTSKKLVDNYVRSVYKREENVTQNWRDGRLLEAVKHGYTLVYDEFTRSRAETNNIFLSILEEGILPLYETKQTEPFVRVHPEFAVIFTSNPEEYAGVYKTQDALLDRLVTIFIGHRNVEREASIINEKVPALAEEDANAIAELTATLRQQCKGSNGPSIRSGLMIAKLAARQDIAIDGEDERFKQLCLDVLTDPMSRCIEADEPLQAARQLIEDTCMNMKKEEQRSDEDEQ
ncbi:gas vesicle protein GvpN [Aciduricibacillus chroicocephali]|uniref:Gas vesicle protein GvpN n=1 Tax=Aciduricibacillus chroicocephali TaxID=3054939 RepID=A0ABY9KUI9_9BACI|nr:gas vesicle protein GvpN [Bacillaceae bacterium 44XB]